ncbi:MAG: tetratricopeptide repeat protein [Thermodesulfovibrionales bacterium]
MNRVFYLIVFLIILLSCKEKSTPQGGRVVNPYATDSVYGEIRERLSKEPNNPDLWYHLADLYDRNGLYAEEVEALKKVIELKPDMGYAYFKIGTAYNRLSRYDDAIANFKKAMRYMPDNPVLYNNLALAYSKKGMRDEEIKTLKKAINLRPNYATARFNLGIAYLKAGNRSAALEQYRRLSEIDQGMAELLKKEIEGGKR